MSDPKEATPDAEAPRATTSSRTSPHEATTSLPAETATSTDDAAPVFDLEARTASEWGRDKYGEPALVVRPMTPDEIKVEQRVEAAIEKKRRRAVEAEELRVYARETVAAGRDQAKAAELTERVAGLWLDRDDMDRLPGPESLLGTLLFRKSLIVLAGAPGSFKSFVALDWAATVSTGKSWQNHGAVRGSVVYLAGEGEAGFPKRLRAWEQEHNNGERVPLSLFPRPMALHKPDAAETEVMVASIVARRPDLVIIDTLNRYTPGMNENSAEEMGQFLQVASRIKDETGACVVVVHHTARDGGNERGSTALRGGSDGLYMMKNPNPDKRTVEFFIDRAKEEASGGKPLKLTLDRVETPIGGSLVIRRTDPFAVDLPAAPPEAMPTAKSDNYIKVLWNVYVHLSETVNGWTEAQIRRQVKASPLNLGPYEVRRWGESWGKVTKKNYLVQSATSSARWELDKHLVENELGFSAEAADYYREFVLEDPGAEAGNDPEAAA